jgi:hypothetical protein
MTITYAETVQLDTVQACGDYVIAQMLASPAAVKNGFPELKAFHAIDTFYIHATEMRAAHGLPRTIGNSLTRVRVAGYIQDWFARQAAQAA